MEIETEYAKISQNKGGAEPADNYTFFYGTCYIYRVFWQGSQNYI
jgi:hypothetical protein